MKSVLLFMLFVVGLGTIDSDQVEAGDKSNCAFCKQFIEWCPSDNYFLPPSNQNQCDVFKACEKAARRAYNPPYTIERCFYDDCSPTGSLHCPEVIESPTGPGSNGIWSCEAACMGVDEAVQ